MAAVDSSVMAQFGYTDENNHCWSSNIIANLHSYFGHSHPVNDLISQTQTVKTGEQLDTGGLDRSADSLNLLEDCRYGPHGAC